MCAKKFHVAGCRVVHVLRSRGCHSVKSTRLTPMCAGFNSQNRHHMWAEFVVGSLLAPRGFSLGTPVFPSPQKLTFPNSSLIQNLRTTGLSVMRLCAFLITQYMSIYFLNTHLLYNDHQTHDFNLIIPV